jgi:hypothetical protein
MRKKNLLIGFWLVLSIITTSVAWSAQKVIAVGTPQVKLSKVKNFRNAQDNFTKLLPAVPFTNVTEMRAATGLLAGRTYSTQGYSSSGDGGEGNFLYTIGDFTSQVTADTLHGIYVPLDSDPTGASGCLVRQYNGAVSVLWYGASESKSGAENIAAAQAAFDSGAKKVSFGKSGTYTYSGQIGLSNGTNLYKASSLEVISEGAVIVADTPLALFTSSRHLSYPSSTSNLFVPKVYFKNLTITESSPSVIFDADRLYNSFVKDCVIDNVTTVFKSFAQKGSFLDGYIQSLTIKDNVFSRIGKIVDAKRALNFTFSGNMCEACLAGVYIDGTGDPAITVLRVEGNLFEGGGVFLKLGSILSGRISGSYLEANSSGDINTYKCHIYMVRSTGGFTSGLTIADNFFQATTAQKIDTDWRDIKFTGGSSVRVSPPVLQGNWTNSYQLITENQIVHSIGNGAFTREALSRAGLPSPPAFAGVSFGKQSRDFDATTYLSAGVYTICEISTTRLKSLASQRIPGTMILNVFIQNKTPGGIVVGASVANILLVWQGAEGTLSSRGVDTIFLGASLISYAEIPAGSVFDTVNGASFKKHFTNPTVTVVANGADNYYIKLSGYAAATNPDYGAATILRSNATMQVFSAANRANTGTNLISIVK